MKRVEGVFHLFPVATKVLYSRSANYDDNIKLRSQVCMFCEACNYSTKFPHAHK